VSGLLLVDKPRGPTSHDVVGRVRRALRQREVGHAGTLDPMATGLLVVGLGQATRLLRFVEADTKTYEATVRLGTSTTTEDAEGEIVEQVALTPPSAEAIDAAVAGLVGPQLQRAPAYSALKQDGVPLHARARRGEVVERPVRPIVVHTFTRIGLDGLDVHVRCVVSKGTYVRTLGVSLGAALGVPAHLVALRRTRIGALDVADAVPLAEVIAAAGEGRARLPIHSPGAAVASRPARAVDPETLRHGRPLDPALADGLEVGDQVRLLAPGANPAAPPRLGGVAEVVLGPEGRGRALAYLCVLHPEHAGEHTEEHADAPPEAAPGAGGVTTIDTLDTRAL
jgi:tRNA pseudouridine55 synthase